MSAIDKDRKPAPSKPLPKTPPAPPKPAKKTAVKSAATAKKAAPAKTTAAKAPATKAAAKKAPVKKAATARKAPAKTAATAAAAVDPAPNPHATAEQVEAAYADTKLAQVLYHDWEAETYDEKWSISFDQRIVDFAKERFDKIVPDATLPYERAMELGCGTGFFLLNLMQAGVAKKGSVTDLSPGMVKVALRNAENLGLDVDGRVADAEKIPYDDDTFDLVVGHAVLHHIPDVEKSLREVLRVLKPGGRFVFAGEPSTIGDFYARRMSRATWWATTNLTKLSPLKAWRRPQEELDESSRAAALEAVVDIHTFSPADLEDLATSAGAVDVETASEELAAAMLGWPVRTFEAAVPKEKLGWGWAGFAYGGYKRMTWLDENVLKRFVPPQFFYNVLITGTKPEK